MTSERTLGAVSRSSAVTRSTRSSHGGLMVESALPFSAWEGFYVITGTSASALTGLQFVLIVLGAEVDAFSSSAMQAFGTPTVVHFGAVLLVAAILGAPWHGLTGAQLCLVISGLIGLAYALRVIRHTRRQTAYVPVLEDWLWHGVFPPVAYAML